MKFGSASRRYKNIYDMYYLKNYIDFEKFDKIINISVFSGPGMRENNYSDILKRVEHTFRDKAYLQRVSTSGQRWIDVDVQTIAGEILAFLRQRKR